MRNILQQKIDMKTISPSMKSSGELGSHQIFIIFAV